MKQDKLWDAFQNDPKLRETFGAAPRFTTLLRHVRKGNQVLNIGVGDGSFEVMALKIGVSIFSLDPSERSIQNLRDSLNLKERAKVGYATAIPFPDAFFDAVVMSEVLEHLDDETISLTLPEVLRVLKPDGCFLGTVPADENLLPSQTVCPDCGKQFHRWGHVQSFSRGRLATVLSTRFGSVSIRRCHFSDRRRLNWKGKVLWLIKRALLSLSVHGRDETFLFEARRS
ncbi:class I SAM-dependent methyltransferase [Inquilinus sp. CAU 1745]|uniref:class I SAM-dependent methyltransferase n=1 Tax=Inquilinus sp. CAU 1745 TaxID=3140369 RepID=UPI00325BE787